MTEWLSCMWRGSLAEVARDGASEQARRGVAADTRARCGPVGTDAGVAAVERGWWVLKKFKELAQDPARHVWVSVPGRKAGARTVTCRPTSLRGLLLRPAHGGSDTCSASAAPSVRGPRSGHCLGDTETAVPGSGGQNWGSAEFGGWTGEACTALPGH